MAVMVTKQKFYCFHGSEKAGFLMWEVLNNTLNKCSAIYELKGKAHIWSSNKYPKWKVIINTSVEDALGVSTDDNLTLQFPLTLHHSRGVQTETHMHARGRTRTLENMCSVK